MSSWYFVKDGQRNGPVGREEFDARVAEGAVDGDTLVWRVGMSSWMRACQVAELGVPPPVLPPALPPREEPEERVPATEFRASGGEATRFERVAAPDYAGFWPRLAAKLIDGLVLYGPTLLVQAGVVATWFDGVTPEFKEMKDLPALLMLNLYCLPFNAAIGAAFSAYFLSKYEATPGKRLLGLRVVRADGGRVGAAGGCGRYFAEWLSALTFYAGYVMAAFDDEKRALHDYVCGTRVVRGARAAERAATPDESRHGVNADGV